MSSRPPPNQSDQEAMDELIKRVEMGAIPVLPGASVLTPRMERLLMKPCSPLPTVVMRIDPCSRHVGDVDVEKAFASLDVKTAAQMDDCMEKARLAPFQEVGNPQDPFQERLMSVGGEFSPWHYEIDSATRCMYKESTEPNPTYA